MTLQQQLVASLELEEEPMTTAMAKPEVMKPEMAVTPMSVLQMAVTQGADIDRLTALMELQERWEANEARKAFNAAMARFKSTAPQLKKNKHVKFTTQKGTTEYDHTTLDHACEELIPALASVGISHKWVTSQDGEKVTVTCVITHEMGHSESTTLTSLPDDSGGKNRIQSLGSAVTYLQRYTFLAAVGIANGSDIDGNSPPAKAMDLKEFDRLSGLIENAGSVESLKQIYLAAAKDASDVGDGTALKQFAEIKDKRYKELARANR